jgi:hypothetical protein
MRDGARGSGVARPGALFGLTLAVFLAHCSFPEYGLEPLVSAGTAGAGAAGAGGVAAGTAGKGPGTSGQGGNSGAAVGLGGAGAPGEGGTLGGGGLGEGGSFACGGEQWPSEQCPGDCLRRFPDHCYDGVGSEQELGVDCGLECERCSNEQCTADADCLSGICDEARSCYAPITVVTTAHETDPIVSSTAWSITLLNAEGEDGRSFALEDLEVRYYFARNGVTEPVLVWDTQADMQRADGQSQVVDGSKWLVERFERTDSVAYDAYVSVRFEIAAQLSPGDELTLYQQLITGDPSTSSFDQRDNYSYTAGTDSEALRITVFHQGKLLWGREPRPANPRVCFARAVNLNGLPVTAAGLPFESAAQSNLTTTGTGVSQENAAFPAVSDGLATMLSTATRLQAGQSFELPVDDGEYLAYLYAVSLGNDGVDGVLTVQGDQPEQSARFRAQSVGSEGWAWARLGPYRAVVNNGSLAVSVTAGAVHLAGLELWYAE